MNKIIVPKAPRPKLPVLNKKTRYVSINLSGGLLRELSCYMKASVKETKTHEKKPEGAGRGGKYYSENRSHYSRF
ncbi:MAG: hypothetical protein LBI28_08955 [Treponema sp.]|jgi:hypothetical protein|nr:hypothetical protein [Treponema sp.]